MMFITNPESAPLRLTELSDLPSSRDRRSALAPAALWQRLWRHNFTVSRQIMATLPRDMWRGPAIAPLTIEPGHRLIHHVITRVALYVHYSPTGQVSAMVLKQLEHLHHAGFAVVFISNAGTTINETHWQAVSARSALMIRRENFAFDFGAWHDVMGHIRRIWPRLDELLLINDSNLGPIRPLDPLIATMRCGGPGLFGLTESLQGGAHLQSYLLLARGAAVPDLMHFIETMRLSHSKWLVIRRGELQLSRWMRTRGHRVAAVFGYDRVIDATLADPAERERLAASHPKLRRITKLPDQETLALLRQWPINPTHHLWHILVTRFNYPFLKTDLVRSNPARVARVFNWPSVLTEETLCSLADINGHLRIIGDRPDNR